MALEALRRWIIRQVGSDGMDVVAVGIMLWLRLAFVLVVAFGGIIALMVLRIFDMEDRLERQRHEVVARQTYSEPSGGH